MRRWRLDWDGGLPRIVYWGADLGDLDRTDRVWAGDRIDALERQQIEPWTRLLLPPELIGSHVGPRPCTPPGVPQSSPSAPAPRSSAISASSGICGPLHPPTGPPSPSGYGCTSGTRCCSTPDGSFGSTLPPAVHVHGVVAPRPVRGAVHRGRRRHFGTHPHGARPHPGLDLDAGYRITPPDLTADVAAFAGRACPPWWTGGTTLPGRVLAEHGVQFPPLFPERLTLVHLIQQAQ
nr:alpha-galactosidase [Nonomuraea turkmeniaca]